MNWKEINEKWPKAYSLFMSARFDRLIAYRKFEVPNDYIGDLYDFFDEQGIIIEIMWYHKDFRMNVWYNKEVKFAGHLNSRQEAEEAAFLKAFEILEEKLRSEER